MESLPRTTDLDEDLRAMGQQMTLPRGLWDYLLSQEIINDHRATLQSHPRGAKRRLSVWEQFYVASGIPPPRTIIEEIAAVSYTGIILKGVEFLESVKVYPAVIEEMRHLTTLRTKSAEVPFGFAAGAEVSDAIIQPITQMTLNAFKISGSGKNMAASIAVARAILDLTPSKEFTATIFFREMVTYEDVIINERRRFNAVPLEMVIVDHRVDSFDDLTPRWWYSPFFTTDDDPLYPRQQHHNPITLRLYVDYELVVQSELNMVALIQDQGDFLFSDIVVSPPLVWSELRPGDDALPPDRYVVLIDVLAPASVQQQGAGRGILDDPARLHSMERIPPSERAAYVAWYQPPGIIMPNVEYILRLYVTPPPQSDLVEFTERLEQELRTSEIARYLVGKQITAVKGPDDLARIFPDAELLAIMQPILPATFVVLDLYHAERQAANLERYFAGVFEETQDVEQDVADRYYLDHKLIPALRKIVVGGRDGIEEIVPEKFMIHNLVARSRHIADDTWQITIRRRAMELYAISLEELRTRLRESGLVVQEIKTLITGDWQITVQSRGDPLEKLRVPPLYRLIHRSEHVDDSWRLFGAARDLDIIRGGLVAVFGAGNVSQGGLTENGEEAIVDVRAEVDPLVTLRPITSSNMVVYAETRGGNIYDILGDIRLDPYASFVADIHVIKEALGIEAARNFLLRTLVENLSQGSDLSLDNRHLLLFVDLVTRSGSLAKAHRLGEHEPASALEMASLRAPIETFQKSVFHRGGATMDIGAHLMMGITPRFGSAANPALIGIEEEPEMQYPEFPDLPPATMFAPQSTPPVALKEQVAEALMERARPGCAPEPAPQTRIEETTRTIVPIAPRQRAFRIPGRIIPKTTPR